MGAVTLYSLVDKHRALELLADSDDIPPEVIRDTLEGLDGEIREKSVSVAHFIRNCESTAEAIEEAAQQMLARAKRLKSRAQSVNDYLLFQLQAAGISKVESPYFTLQVKKNPPAVVIDSENLIPAKFMRTPAPLPPPKPAPDKAAIAAAIKAGEEVPGAHSAQGERLEIKV
jgi:hypothetical protein